MKIQCPKCKETIVVNGLGRKKLNMDAKIIYGALQAHHTVTAAALSLGCSRGYIYGVLNDYKLKGSFCVICGKSLEGVKNCQRHHVSYKKNHIIYVCNSCHCKIHNPRQKK